MLGIFARVVRDQRVKSRLRGLLSRRETERFHVASLADTLETALAVAQAPVLFLRSGEDAASVEDLRARLQAIDFGPTMWSRLRVWDQTGPDLGARLQNAFEAMYALSRDNAESGPASRGELIIGSDSPSLTPEMLNRSLLVLAAIEPTDATPEVRARSQSPQPRPPDLILGPTADGGFWCIGVRRPHAGLLVHGIEWSSERTLAHTLERGRALNLRVRLVESWTDVDRPEDLQTLWRQIQACRARGDLRTARRVQRLLRDPKFRDVLETH